MANDSFSENPFAALDRKLFRDGGGKPRPAQDRKHADRVRPSLKDAAGHQTAAEDADDAHLFLRAVQQVERKKTAGKGGFAMRDHQAFAPLAAECDAALDAEEGAAFCAAMVRQGSRSAPASRNLAARRRAQEDRRASCAWTDGAKREAGATPAPEAPDDGVAALERMAEAEADSDASAFAAAMRQVAPLSGKGRDVAPQPRPGTPPPGGELGMQDVLDGKLEFALSLTGEYLEGFVVGLDEMIMNRLRAGSYSPEAHLDLHGLNAMQAFQALLNFVRQSWFKGLRTVLVVPGRGLNSPNGYGILRDRLQLWLTQDPFKRVVLAFCTAKPVDGGPGSVYVLLRKYRKKGHIYWERMPTDPDLV